MRFNNFVLLSAIFLFLLPGVYAVVSHSASQVTSGIFGSGDYTFPNNLVVTGNLGVGVAPTYKLDVAGDVRWSGTLVSGSVPWTSVTGAPVGILTEDKKCKAKSGKIECSFTDTVDETDPQVGAITASKWCRGDGSAVQCDQDAPTGGLTGSGVSNYLPRWTGTNTLGYYSSIYVDGAYMGINVMSPQANLDVGSTGSIRLGGVIRTTWPAAICRTVSSTLSQQDVSVNCDSTTEVVTGGGCSYAGAGTCAVVRASNPSGSGWHCFLGGDCNWANGVSAYAICCKKNT